MFSPVVEWMGNTSATSRGSGRDLTGRVAREGKARRWSARSRRIVLLLAAIWMINLFDLTFTVLAHNTGNFVEANPIARALLDNRPALLAFKLGAMVIATGILVCLRRHWLAELGCWFLCGAFATLAFMWLVYYRSWER